MKNLFKSAILTGVLVCAASTADAQVASNPPYTLNQAVIAGGGGTSADAGSQFSITGTIGQALTDTSTNATFTVKSGFFTAPSPLAPTAAEVTLGGRAISAMGRGIRNVTIVLTDASGNTRTVRTTAFGKYQFTGVLAGETYIITAKGKRYSFTQPSQVVNITEDATDINFTGN